MMHHNITSSRELTDYYFKKILNITRELKTIPIVWQELFDDHIHLDSNVVIQIWKENYINTLTKVNKIFYITSHLSHIINEFYFNHATTACYNRIVYK